MVALYGIEAIFGTIVALIILFQILVPLFIGEPLFPIFRKKKIAVEKDLAEAKEDVTSAHVERTTAQMKRTAEEIRASLSPKEPNGDPRSGEHPKVDSQ